MSWGSWATLEHEYRQTRDELCAAKDRMKEDPNATIADLETIPGMISEVSETGKVLKDMILYEFNSLSEEELALLTDRQREIATLRQRYSYTEIGKMLGVSPKTVFDVFRKAVRNVKKAKKQQSQNIPAGLSPQQGKIYVLYQQGKKPKEIALILNTSYSNVRYQLSMIKRNVLVKSQEK
jgi:DNA-binding CsgD family transcriptional regulator